MSFICKCDHMRKFAAMSGAQEGLVTLVLEVVDLFLIIADYEDILHKLTPLLPRHSCVHRWYKRHAVLLLHQWAYFLAYHVQPIESMEKGGLRNELHWAFFFFIFGVWAMYAGLSPGRGQDRFYTQHVSHCVSAVAYQLWSIHLVLVCSGKCTM